MKVHRSARKHGVLPEDARQAADLALWIEPLEDEEWPHRELRRAAPGDRCADLP